MLFRSEPLRRAWSRSRKHSLPFCHRPGCYEPLPEGSRAPSTASVAQALSRSESVWHIVRQRGKYPGPSEVRDETSIAGAYRHRGRQIVGDPSLALTYRRRPSSTHVGTAPSTLWDRLRLSWTNGRSSPSPTRRMTMRLPHGVLTAAAVGRGSSASGLVSACPSPDYSWCLRNLT